MTTLPPASRVPLIDGLSAIADRYDAVLCDIWGVLHNGRQAFPPACEALAAFRRRGGAVVLISNAPRPNAQFVRKSSASAFRPTSSTRSSPRET